MGDGRFLYLASVIDLYSHRLAGWSIADHMRTDLITDALRAAAATRGSLAGAILHTGTHRFESARHARLAVFRWITRYNTRRRHSTLGHTSPIIYEQQAGTVLAAARQAVPTPLGEAP
ncbi:hypothetical protein AWN90_04335 [Nocardia terpenica]|uniref:Integrase catalytic domain-containing protein n=1 Tax=Nocardia terpenica TaxID=455432 RepID=A0A164IXY3_9NOCA|nr:hypothetical protein AWN90_04335 [Nocardia terpenica]